MKMKVFLIVIFSSFLFLLLVKLFFKNKTFEKKGKVCFKNHCFEVELAKTIREKSVGLMGREELGPKSGMLFVFNKEGKHSFWMKNTLIPLDIIWINEGKEVVFISENTKPCKKALCPMIKPTEKAKYVLEINGGMAKEIGLKVRDRVKIEYLEN